MPDTQATLKALLVNRPASEPVDQGLYVKLTASELEILDLLAEQAGQARNVFIRQMIINEAMNHTAGKPRPPAAGGTKENMMSDLKKLKEQIERKYKFAAPAGPGWDDALADAMARQGLADRNGSVYAYEILERDFGKGAAAKAFFGLAGGRWMDGSFPSETEGEMLGL